LSGRCEVDVELRDLADSPVAEAAIAGGVEAIVSGDLDLLDDADLVAWLGDRDVEVLTPVQVLARLG